MANPQAEYLEKLRDPRWQKKRLLILERDHWKCRCCGDSDKTLHVHHLFYFKDKAPWEINDGFLLTLCQECHAPSNDEFWSTSQVIISDIGDLLQRVWETDITASELALINLTKRELLL